MGGQWGDEGKGNFTPTIFKEIENIEKQGIKHERRIKISFIVRYSSNTTKNNFQRKMLESEEQKEELDHVIV